MVIFDDIDKYTCRIITSLKVPSPVTCRVRHTSTMTLEIT